MSREEARTAFQVTSAPGGRFARFVSSAGWQYLGRSIGTQVGLGPADDKDGGTSSEAQRQLAHSTCFCSTQCQLVGVEFPRSRRATDGWRLTTSRNVPPDPRKWGCSALNHSIRNSARTAARLISATTTRASTNAVHSLRRWKKPDLVSSAVIYSLIESFSCFNRQDHTTPRRRKAQRSIEPQTPEGGLLGTQTGVERPAPRPREATSNDGRYDPIPRRL